MLTKLHCIIVVLLFACSFIGCTQRTPSTNDTGDKCTTHYLKTDSIIGLEGYGIMSPYYIITTPDGVVIGSDDRDSCSITILTNGQIIRGIGYGGGPNEIYELSSIRCADDRLYVYDSSKGRLSQIIITNNDLTLNVVKDDLRLLDDAALIDAHILTANVDKSYSYALLSSDGQLEDTLQYFPPSPDGIKPVTRSLNNTGSLTIMSACNLFARCTVFDGGVDFFSISNDSIIHISRYSIFNKVYSVAPDGISPSPNKDTRLGYTQVKSSCNFFYASFSDEKALENPDALTNEIHVFSPFGEFIARYILDCDFSEFDVSADDTLIYALSGVDTSQISIFKIPSETFDKLK